MGVVLLMKKKQFSIAMLSTLILFSHLISGVTWSAHLVTFIFCLVPILIIDTSKLATRGRVIYYSILGVLLILSFEGYDTFGNSAYLALRYYDIFTIQMLALIAFNAWIVLAKNAKSIFPESSREYI